jgi:hypothetical protein
LGAFLTTIESNVYWKTAIKSYSKVTIEFFALSHPVPNKNKKIGKCFA